MSCPVILETIQVPCERDTVPGSPFCKYHTKKTTGVTPPPPACSCGGGQPILYKWGVCRNCHARAVRAQRLTS